MGTLFLLLFLASIICLIAGLIKPTAFSRFIKGEITRKKIGLIFGIAITALIVLLPLAWLLGTYIGRNIGASGGARTQTDQYEDSLKRLKTQTDKTKKAQKEYKDALKEVEDLTLDAYENSLDLIDANAEIQRLEDEGKKHTNEKKKAFYDLVALQDSNPYNALDSKYDPDWYDKAYIIIAKKYNISENEMRKIAIEGVKNNWPLP